MTSFMAQNPFLGPELVPQGRSQKELLVLLSLQLSAALEPTNGEKGPGAQDLL